MSTQVPANLGWGGSGLDKTLLSLLNGLALDAKLAQLKISAAVTGGASGAELSCAEIAAGDTLIGAIVLDGMGAATPSFSAVRIVPTGGVTHGLTDDATPVAEAGTVKLNVATTDAVVYVIYCDISARNITGSTES